MFIEDAETRHRVVIACRVTVRVPVFLHLMAMAPSLCDEEMNV